MKNPKELAGQSTDEIRQVMNALDKADCERAVRAIQEADRLFFYGAGRSGLMLRAMAMRLMHAGFTCHVAGDATTPAIQKGDLLVTASASGKTATTKLMMEKANQAGAGILMVTAEHGLVPPYAKVTIRLKTDTPKSDTNANTKQIGGNTFEQCVLVLADALAQALYPEDKERANQDLMARHANLE